MDFEATGLGVLVGVDGSAGATTALEFAATEARVRRAPLTACHVLPRSGHATSVPAVTSVLDAAGARLARIAPDVPVRLLAEDGHPARVLTALAGDAEVTVVGSRGRGGVTGLLLGSVGQHLVTRAPAPVVVVHRSRPSVGPATFGGHVVVGVDGSEGSAAALRFAFTEADRRGCPLAAVHVRRLGPTDSYVDDRTLELHTAVREPGRELLDDAVDPWTVRFPHVVVRRALYHGSPAAGLLRAADRAVLLVVGRTGRGAAAGALFGSVSQAVVHRNPGPVAVVPTPSAG